MILFYNKQNHFLNHQLKILFDADEGKNRLTSNRASKKKCLKMKKKIVDISIKNAVNKNQRLWHLYFKQKISKNRKRYNEQAKKS